MTWLLVSDVDDTLTGDEAALAELATAFAANRPQLIVAYNSSRPCASVRQTLGALPALPVPDYLIGALGTEIEHGRSGERLIEYEADLLDGWDRARIDKIARELGCRPHAEEFQTSLKASYDIAGPAVYRRFLSALDELGVRAKIIFSNEIKLDVVPEAAGKASAIHYLVATLGLSPRQVVVAGDSGNDRDMFVAPFRGIVVGNADADLKDLTGDNIYFARGFHAAGVREGLHHWGVLPWEGV